MRTQLVWEEEIPPPEDQSLTNIIWAVAFSPDGTLVIVAVGDRILMHETVNYTVAKVLKGHRGTIYCLAFSKDGKRFASGGVDKRVIIWSSQGEGLMKYNHNSTIQCLSYNPLASGTGEDFGLWFPDQRNVVKHKVSAKCLCCDWSPDGQILAIGMFDGTVLFRDKSGDQLGEVKRTSAIWCLGFNPVKQESSDNTLVLGCWDQTLTLWKITGGSGYSMIGNEKPLQGNPCSISFFNTGEYFTVAGADKEIHLWTKDGILLGRIGSHKDWIWTAGVKPKSQIVVSGANDGTIKVHQIIFSIVHGLYQDRYAHRELMTDVLIQHLVTETRVRIRCRDYVKKIAIYKDRLAVQLPEKIVIYSISPDDPFDMKYKAFKKISKKVECSLLVVTSENLILCLERKLQLLNLSGDLEHEWNFESIIRYIKVIGGPTGREGVLVGLRNGTVIKLFVDNPFPIPLIKQATPIRCLDISLEKKKLAVVDDNYNLYVYSIETQELLYTESKATSVAWNSEMEDMLAFSGNNVLSIKTLDFQPITQRLQGFVVGFKNNKIFCLHFLSMNTVDVPQSSTMFRLIDRKMYDLAYSVACLGVTEQDWRVLGTEALKNKSFNVARKAFIWLKDLKFIELVGKIEKESKNPSIIESQFTGIILANQGKYKEAATTMIKGGLGEMALQIFYDLKKFGEVGPLIAQIDKRNKTKGEVTEFNTQETTKRMMVSQADWLFQKGDLKASAELLGKAGEYKRAIEIFGQIDELDAIYSILKSLDKKTHEESILKSAKIFKAKGNHAYAKEACLRLGDIKGLMALHVELKKWKEAFMLAKQNPDLVHLIYVPYADWLCSRNKFNKAQEAYKKGNRPDLALRIIECLCHNAVIERRFKDASHYFWILAKENLKMVKNATNLSEIDEEHLKEFENKKELALIYYAYQIVHKYMEEPFQDVMVGGGYHNYVFNAACYLLNVMANKSFYNLSKVHILYAIARIGSKLEAYKTARTAFDKLQGYKIPTEWQDILDLENLRMRTKAYSDKEGTTPSCNRCMNGNSFLNFQNDDCTFCGHPFMRSYISFDPIPLVEFSLPTGVNHGKAMVLLKDTLGTGPKKKQPKGDDGWKETVMEGAQTLSLAPQAEELSEDPFFQHTQEHTAMQVDPENYKPVPVTKELLLHMNHQEVFIEDLSHICPTYPKRYFKNMFPEVPLYMCENCRRIFHQDEYEFSYLEHKSCPFCRFQEEGAEEVEDEEEEEDPNAMICQFNQTTILIIMDCAYMYVSKYGEIIHKSYISKRN